MKLSTLTSLLFQWIEDARDNASIARTWAPIPGFQSLALESAFACRRAIERMSLLFIQATRPAL